MSVDVKELLANPETIPFSRLKYLARGSEEDVAKFFNELFNLAAVAKDEGDWSPVEQFLDRWEDLLVLRLEPPLRFEKAPWAPFTKPLSEARIAVLTTGGIYVEGQSPFDVTGDWSFREIPLDSPTDRFRVAHTHYDTTGVAEDVDAVLAIHRLLELEAEGVIGEAQSPAYSFIGYIPDPSGLIEVTAPEVGELLKEAKVDGAVIGTT
jgi:D-proline reductase (dithiol) PrdB